MTKQQAITKIKLIQSGGYDRSSFPSNLRGRVAIKYWPDPMFQYGMEYGAIHGLMMAFNITEEDLLAKL